MESVNYMTTTCRGCGEYLDLQDKTNSNIRGVAAHGRCAKTFELWDKHKVAAPFEELRAKLAVHLFGKVLSNPAYHPKEGIPFDANLAVETVDAILAAVRQTGEAMTNERAEKIAALPLPELERRYQDLFLKPPFESESGAYFSWTPFKDRKGTSKLYRSREEALDDRPPVTDTEVMAALDALPGEWLITIFEQMATWVFDDKADENVSVAFKRAVLSAAITGPEGTPHE